MNGCDKEDLLTNEQFYLDSYRPYFNGSLKAGSVFGIKRGAPWNKGKKTSGKTIQKLRISHLGQVAWNKGKKTGQIVWNKGMKGAYTFKMPEEAKKKISRAMKGNKRTLGRKHSEEAKQKMREKAIGRKMSAEAIEKIRQKSIGNKNMLGKKRSEETKKRVSEGLKRYFRNKKVA